MVVLLVGRVGECCSEIGTQMLFLSQTLKNFVGIFLECCSVSMGKSSGSGMSWK